MIVSLKSLSIKDYRQFLISLTAVNPQLNKALKLAKQAWVVIFVFIQVGITTIIYCSPKTIR